MENNTTPTPFSQLSDLHKEILTRNSGITPEIINARGYRTITVKQELQRLGFSSNQCRVPGLLIPVHTPDGRTPLHNYHPDNPRTIRGKAIKYEIPKGSGLRLDCPPLCRFSLKDPKIPLWITVGQKKADALASQGVCAIDILAPWGYKGKNDLGGTVFSNDWDYIALDKRPVILIQDFDESSTPEIKKTLRRLAEHLERKETVVRSIDLSKHTGGQTCGVDEWLANGHTIADLEKLLEEPEPLRTPQQPRYVINTEDKLEMTRPLAILAGKAYFAGYCNVKEITTETMDKAGNIVTHDPPIEKQVRKLLAIDEAGEMWGGKGPLEELPFTIKLSDNLDPSKSWTGMGIRRFQKGERPLPHEVWNNLMKIVDHFIDFHQSLANQEHMCEMICCYVLSTWFLDAFNVVGYLWISGERGSGKSDLLQLIAELSYLGQFISFSGSFASLRDMADMGATLAFDDAEGITYSNNIDQDKRAILLAGNRRGMKISLKEQGPDKTWKTRLVDVFCPRLFSAIRIPDSVLASRSIFIPMVRTTDKHRGNIDPMDYSEWPVDRRQLIDDLWALGLCNLSKLPDWDRWVGENARLVGRDLQPWRAILATAKWMDEMGMTGLFRRMEELSINYQKQRLELELSDITRMVLASLLRCAKSAIDANRAIRKKSFDVTVSEVVENAKKVIEEDDLDLDPDKITNRSIGRKLSRLRFNSLARSGGKGSRKWEINIQYLKQLAESYNVTIQPELSNENLENNEISGLDGTNGIVGTDGTLHIDLNAPHEGIYPTEKPEGNCSNCGENKYWQRDDSRWICERCHPNPS